MISLALLAVLSASPLSAAEQKLASMDGKYQKLLRVMTVPEDRAQYGEHYDWGWWPHTEYKGHSGLTPGFWVYVFPRWYVWKTEVGADPKRPEPGGQAPATTPAE